MMYALYIALQIGLKGWRAREEGTPRNDFIHIHIYINCSRDWLQEINMAMSPRNIMSRLGSTLPDGLATEKQIRRAFYNAGYGKGKADKWIGLYKAEDIIKTEHLNDNGEILYSCVWWVNYLA